MFIVMSIIDEISRQARNDSVGGGPSTGSGTAVGEPVEPLGPLGALNVLKPFYKPIETISYGIEACLNRAKILFDAIALITPF